LRGRSEGGKVEGRRGEGGGSDRGMEEGKEERGRAEGTEGGRKDQLDKLYGIALYFSTYCEVPLLLIKWL